MECVYGQKCLALTVTALVHSEKLALSSLRFWLCSAVGQGKLLKICIKIRSYSIDLNALYFRKINSCPSPEIIGLENCQLLWIYQEHHHYFGSSF